MKEKYSDLGEGEGRVEELDITTQDLILQNLASSKNRPNVQLGRVKDPRWSPATSATYLWGGEASNPLYLKKWEAIVLSIEDSSRRVRRDILCS